MFNNRSCFWMVVSMVVGTVGSLGSGRVLAAAFRTGDRVVTVDQAPLMDGDRTVLVVPAGKELVATDVRGNWVAVAVEEGGRQATGWIDDGHLAYTRRGLQLAHNERDGVQSGQAKWWGLPNNEPLVIAVTSDVPVDVFIVTDEELASIKWTARNGSSQVRTYQCQKGVRRAEVDWQPSDGRKYYLVVDNSFFLDDGAQPSDNASFSLQIYRKATVPSSTGSRVRAPRILEPAPPSERRIPAPAPPQPTRVRMSSGLKIA